MCVPLSCSPFIFIVTSAVMGNSSLHLLATAKALQVGVLICITSMLLLFRLLLFHFNAHHKCVTYVCFINDYRMVLIFWTYQVVNQMHLDQDWKDFDNHQYGDCVGFKMAWITPKTSPSRMTSFRSLLLC